MNHPQGWTKWRHRETGVRYDFLTVALGAGGDADEEFAYYMGPDDRHPGLQRAYVMRLDEWSTTMEYLGTTAELAGSPPADGALDELI